MSPLVFCFRITAQKWPASGPHAAHPAGGCDDSTWLRGTRSTLAHLALHCTRALARDLCPMAGVSMRSHVAWRSAAFGLRPATS